MTFWRYEPGRVPWLFVASLLTCALMLIWMGAHGFPVYTADALPVKQPAIMYLRDGLFSVPNYQGIFPYTELRAMAYPPLYTYVNLAAFKVFGISSSSSLALDLLLHFGIVVMVGWLILRATRNQLVAAVFPFLSLHLMLPIGRPEELAILLGLGGAATYAFTRHKLLGTLLLSGVAMTSPSNAVKAWVLAAALDLVRTQLSWRWLALTAARGAGSLALALAVWAAYVYPYFTEAAVQFDKIRAGSHQPSLLEVLGTTSPLTTAYIGLFLVVMASGVPWLKWAARSGVDARVIAAVRGSILALPVLLLVDMFFKRPIYDYRFDVYLALATASCMAALVFDGVRARRPYLAGATLAAALALALVPNLLIFRYTLAPLAWDERSLTLDAAVARLEKVIPAGASVGGDVTYWPLAASHPRYVMFYNRTFEQWPDYVLAAAWTSPDNISQRREWAAYLAKEYEPVPEATDSFAAGCSLKLLGVRLPIAHGTCDFKMRVWKRRSPLGAATAANGLVH